MSYSPFWATPPRPGLSPNFRCEKRSFIVPPALLRRADFGMVRADLGQRLILSGAASSIVCASSPVRPMAPVGTEIRIGLFHDSFVGDCALWSTVDCVRHLGDVLGAWR